MSDLDVSPTPQGELQLKLIAMPSDTNFDGDIFGGWLVSKMDLAGSMLAKQMAQGRIATVAMESMSFLSPVKVGDSLSFYVDTLAKGRSSMTLAVEVWNNSAADIETAKVTDGVFVFVAIDHEGRTRLID